MITVCNNHDVFLVIGVCVVEEGSMFRELQVVDSTKKFLIVHKVHL